MSNDFYQNGRLKTVITVNLTEAIFLDSYGTWSIYPLDTVYANNDFTRIFQCVNKGSLVCGPKGRVKYESEDASVFTIEFDCPTSDPNVCNVSVSDGSPWMISGSVPAHGHDDINYDCTIKQKSYNAIVDVPVSASDILQAPKCDLISEEEINKCLNGRMRVCLKDVFAEKSLLPAAKLWCAKHMLFLTPQSKAVLSRAFAQRLLCTNPQEGAEVQRLMDLALTYNEDVSRGDISESKRQELSTYNEKVFAQSRSESDAGWHSVVYALLNPDQSEGWKYMVNAYIQRHRKEGLLQRQQTMIHFIEEQLCIK